LKSLATFMGNLGKAAGNMGGASFTVLGTLLKILASFSPDVLTAIVYAWLAWNAALTAYNIVAFIAATATTAMALAAAPFGLLLIGAAVTIGLVILALIALGVAIFFIVKYWDQIWGAVKATAITVWGVAGHCLGATWKFIKDLAVSVWNWLSGGWHQFLLLLLGPLGLLVSSVCTGRKSGPPCRRRRRC